MITMHKHYATTFLQLQARTTVAEQLARDAFGRRAFEQLASDELAAARQELAKAQADYEKRPSEALRLRVRALTEALPTLHAAFKAARADVDRSVDGVARADAEIARLGGDFHDPALLAASSSQLALTLVTKAEAEGLARGDDDIAIVRKLVDGGVAINTAAGVMRSHGAARPDVATAIIVLVVLEAFLDRGIVAISDPWLASFAPPLKVHAMSLWLREVSDRSPSVPAAVANARALLQRIRQAVAEHGIRNGSEFRQVEDAAEIARRSAAPASNVPAWPPSSDEQHEMIVERRGPFATTGDDQ